MTIDGKLEILKCRLSDKALKATCVAGRESVSLCDREEEKMRTSRTSFVSLSPRPLTTRYRLL